MNAVHRAKAALDALAEALASGDPDRVLANEMALAAAAADLSQLSRAGVTPSSMGEALVLRGDLRDARASLDRCRALGATVTDLAAALFAAPTGYSASGTMKAAPVASFFSSRS